MPDMKIVTTSSVIPDDGKDGIFWRDGIRWLRSTGKEVKLLDIAPHLESQFMMERKFDEITREALESSRTPLE
jgi:hypothetical protein